MGRFLRALECTAIVGLLIVALGRDAYAYLDPGTASYVVQMIIAGVVGALFVIKLYWVKLRLFIVGLFRRPKPEPEGKSEQQ